MAATVPPGLEAELALTPPMAMYNNDYHQLYQSLQRHYLQILGPALAGDVACNPLLQQSHIPLQHDTYGAKVEMGDELRATCTPPAASCPMKVSKLVPMKLKLPGSDGTDGLHESPGTPMEIGATLRAACAAEFELVPTQLSMSGPSDGSDSPVASKGASLGRWAIANGVTTLQCHGLDRNATLEELVVALNAEGLAGCYNFVSIPRRLHGDGLGYAFINFTTPQSAAMLVERWQGVPCPHPCLGRRVRFSSAEKQGYHKHVSQKGLRKFDRIRKTSLWPLVMSEDGRDVVFGSDEAIAAALSASPTAAVL